MTEQTLEISWKTIFKVFIAGLLFYILYSIREIILWAFFGLVISLLLDPLINFLRKIGFPKIIAIASVYIFVFGILGILIYLVAPFFIFEIKQFSKEIPDYFERINPLLRQWGIEAAYSFDEFVKEIIIRLENSSRGILYAIASFFGGIASALLILSLAFFISLEEKGLEKLLIFLLPQKYEERVIYVLERTQRKVAGWFGARVLACLFVGVLSGIVFYIFNIKYAFLLALVAGLLNFVLYIGPWITAILIFIIVTVSQSFLVALYVLLAFGIIQAIEGNFLTPLLMKKIIGLPPVFVLLSLLIGAQLFGFLGLVFAIPVCGVFYEFLKDFFAKRKERELKE